MRKYISMLFLLALSQVDIYSMNSSRATGSNNGKKDLIKKLYHDIVDQDKNFTDFVEDFNKLEECYTLVDHSELYFHNQYNFNNQSDEESNEDYDPGKSLLYLAIKYNKPEIAQFLVKTQAADFLDPVDSHVGVFCHIGCPNSILHEALKIHRDHIASFLPLVHEDAIKRELESYGIYYGNGMGDVSHIKIFIDWLNKNKKFVLEEFLEDFYGAGNYQALAVFLSLGCTLGEKQLNFVWNYVVHSMVNYNFDALTNPYDFDYRTAMINCIKQDPSIINVKVKNTDTDYVYGIVNIADYESIECSENSAMVLFYKKGKCFESDFILDIPNIDISYEDVNILIEEEQKLNENNNLNDNNNWNFRNNFLLRSRRIEKLTEMQQKYVAAENTAREYNKKFEVDRFEKYKSRAFAISLSGLAISACWYGLTYKTRSNTSFMNSVKPIALLGAGSLATFGYALELKFDPFGRHKKVIDNIK